VEDLTRTKAFYEKLGFKENGSGYLPTPEGDIQIRFLEKNGFVIEVIEMIGEGLAELKKRGALAAVECELVSKAMESALHELETLCTEESRQALFDRLHNGGMRALGFDYLLANPRARNRLGRGQVKRCKKIVRMSWNEYKQAPKNDRALCSSRGTHWI